MATKKAAKKSTAIVRWDEKFASSAKAAKEQVANINSGGVSIKFGHGTIEVGKTPVKGNKLECVILGFVALNRYNIAAYDASNTQPPDCYAFSLIADDPEMVPHTAATSKQSPDCASCPQNVFGSASNKKGKACANTLRVGALTGKDVLEDAAGAASAEMATASVSPTNRIHLTNYQAQVLEETGRPLWAVVTEVQSHHDDKTQIRLEFRMVSIIEDDDVLTALEKRTEKIHETLMKPFPAPTDKSKGAQLTTGANKKFSAAKKGAKR